MLGYILKRVLLMVPTLLGALTITFVVMQFVPGGPVEQILAEAQAGAGGGGEGYRAGKDLDKKQIEELKKLGIEYTERLVDFALFRRRLEAFDYDINIIVEPKFTLPDSGQISSLYGSESARKPGGQNFRGIQSKVVDMLIERIAQAPTLDELRTAARALDRVVMWQWASAPMLYSRTLNVSYWNRFGIPAQPAHHMDIDTLIQVYSQPWPLWAWWDKALAPTQQPIPAFKE